MADYLAVVIHGTGDQDTKFVDRWTSGIQKNFPKQKIQGLYWEDLRQEVQDAVLPGGKDIPEEVLAAAKKFKVEGLVKFLDEENYQTVKDHVMDVVFYLALNNFGSNLREKALRRLYELLDKNKVAEKNVILIGHSLGAVLAVHLAAINRSIQGYIPYRGVITLGSPLPLDLGDNFPSFVGPMADYLNTQDRLETLRVFANLCANPDDPGYYDIVNENDIICSDATYDIGGGNQFDVLPVRNGWSPQDRVALREGGGDFACLAFSSGKRDRKALAKVGDAHDLLLYLGSEPFVSSLARLLKTK